MIVVKLTVLCFIATAIYMFFYIPYLKSNPQEIILSDLFKSYVPKGGYVATILVLLDIIGLLASAVYLLFFR